MSQLNAFAAARLEMALDRIDLVLGHLEGCMDSSPRSVLLRAKGDLVAMRQLLELEAELGGADTQPAPKLTVVR